LVSFFTSPDDLARTVGVSTSLTAAKAWLQPLKGVESLAEVQRLPLDESYLPNIIQATRSLGRELEDVRVLDIDLQRGDYYWWSTRLFLVAALTAEYTSVDCLAFVTEGDRFLGLASAWTTLNALSKAFPEVAKAYYSTLRQPDPNVDPTDEIVSRVQNFSIALGRLQGGEEANKFDVSPQLLQRWLGTELAQDSLEADSLQANSAGLELLYANRASDRRFPYVALVREGKLVRVVDRAALAINVVRGYIKVTRG
jgi:hypothetical protein